MHETVCSHDLLCNREGEASGSFHLDAAGIIVFVRAYSVVDGRPPREAVEVFLDRSDAETFVTECLRDEPDWVEILSVVPIELDERAVSEN